MFLAKFSDRIIYFDICAVIIFTVLLVSLVARKMIKGNSYTSFMFILIVSLLTAAIDLLCSLYATVLPRTQGNLTFRYIIHCLYFIFRNFAPLAYVSYIISVSSSWILFKENKYQAVILFTPYIILFLIVCTNCFTGFVFSFDEEMLYQRGKGIWSLYAVAAFYLIYAVYYLLRCRTLFSRSQFVALVAMIPITLLSIVIQMLCPRLLVEMFATSVACLILSITIQSPENLMDQDTGFFNQKTYLFETRRNFILNRKMNIVFVGLQNFKDLQVILNYSGFSAMLKNVAEALESIKRESKLLSDLFYLKNGLFAFISYEHALSETKEIAQKFHDFMLQTMKIEQLEIKIIPRVCYFQTPKDIDSYKSLLSFGKFHQVLLPHSKTFVDVSG